MSVFFLLFIKRFHLQWELYLITLIWNNEKISANSYLCMIKNPLYLFFNWSKESIGDEVENSLFLFYFFLKKELLTLTFHIPLFSPLFLYSSPFILLLLSPISFSFYLNSYLALSPWNNICVVWKSRTPFLFSRSSSFFFYKHVYSFISTWTSYYISNNCFRRLCWVWYHYSANWEKIIEEGFSL